MLAFLKEIAIFLGVGAFAGTFVGLAIAFYANKSKAAVESLSKEIEAEASAFQAADEQDIQPIQSAANLDSEVVIETKTFQDEVQEPQQYQAQEQYQDQVEFGLKGYLRRGIIDLLKDIEPKRGKKLTGGQMLNNAVRRRLRSKFQS